MISANEADRIGLGFARALLIWIPIAAVIDAAVAWAIWWAL
jgi:hypothetical protein